MRATHLEPSLIVELTDVLNEEGAAASAGLSNARWGRCVGDWRMAARGHRLAGDEQREGYAG
jgi:hypothetical protein